MQSPCTQVRFKLLCMCVCTLDAFQGQSISDAVLMHQREYICICLCRCVCTTAHHSPRYSCRSTSAAPSKFSSNTGGRIMCVPMTVCTCSEVLMEVCIQFCLTAASNPGGRQMAERIESTVNGKQSAELVITLFTHTHTSLRPGVPVLQPIGTSPIP